jgi:hypothetical protein
VTCAVTHHAGARLNFIHARRVDGVAAGAQPPAIATMTATSTTGWELTRLAGLKRLLEKGSCAVRTAGVDASAD